jgi:hypothetical protein
MAASPVAIGRTRTRLLSEPALLHWTLFGLVVWQIGLYFDVWNHLQFGFAIESFVSWSHAALYGGWFLTGLPTLVYVLDCAVGGVRRPDLPRGHLAVLLGVGLYGVGGAFDFVWHDLVGFEARHDAALAPSHVWLAIAFTLASFGTLIAAIHQGRDVPASAARVADLRIALALGACLMLFNWYVSYGSPLATDFATGGTAVRELPGYADLAWTNVAADIGATNGLLLFNVIMMLVVLFALRSLRLGTGAIAIMLAGEALIVVPATNQWLALPSMIGAALATETLWWWVRRGALGGPYSTLAYCVIAGALGLVQVTLYLLVLGIFGGGLIWKPHLWVGVPLAATTLGVIVALLVAPPAMLTARTRYPGAGQSGAP